MRVPLRVKCVIKCGCLCWMRLLQNAGSDASLMMTMVVMVVMMKVVVMMVVVLVRL